MLSCHTKLQLQEVYTGIGSGYWDQGRQEVNKTVAWFKESDIFFNHAISFNLNWLKM